jgi:hypothetical protein
VILERLVELQGRQRVVLVVCQRVRHRALVAVVRREVENVVEITGQARQHVVVVDRRFDESHSGVVRKVLSLRAEQVVDHEHLARRARQQGAHEIGANKAGAPHDEDLLPLVQHGRRV